MEVYCIDEVVVPNQKDDSCWLEWGKNAPHSFGLGNNYNYFLMGSDLTHDELNDNGKRCSSYDLDMGPSIYTKPRSADDDDDIFMFDSQKYATTDEWEDHQSVPQVEHLSLSDESLGGYVDEDTSIEEFILQDLEIVMTQLTDKTRICFRDALYRLANNSNQHMVEAPPWTPYADDTTRPQRKQAMEPETDTASMESKTNTIDRTIANLMYSEMESNVSDILFTAPPDLEQEVVEVSGLQHYSASHKDNTLSGDAEVPVHNVREESTHNASM